MPGIRNKLFFLLFLVLVYPLQPQPVAQEIIAATDRYLNLTDGWYRGVLIQQENGKIRELLTEMYIRDGRKLLLFREKDQRPVLKILYTENRKCYFYPDLSGRLGEIRNRAWTREIPGFFFSWLDFSGIPLESLYTPASISSRETGNRSAWRIALIPSRETGYKKLVLLADRISRIPLKTELYDDNGILYRDLKMKEGILKIRKNNKWQKLKRITTLETLPLDSNSSSEWILQEYHPAKLLDPEYFTPEGLQK